MKKLLIFLAVCAALVCGAACLSACADAKEYSVACQTCENGCVVVSGTEVKAGEKVILASHPSAGYKLTAFLLDGEVLEGCSFVMPERDVTVSATFGLITYSVTYVPGDAVAQGNNPDTYTVESATVLHSPRKEGYEICGWYRYCTEAEYGWDIEDYRVSSLEGLSGNLTLYAKYYNIPHMISVGDIDNGWCYVEDYGYEAYYGETYNISANPYDGYELDYVAVNGERIEGTSFIMPLGDAEITAVFKPVIYAITYELDGGTNSPDNPSFYTVEDGYITISDAHKEGYIFCGWFFDEQHTEPLYNSFDVSLRNPVTLYAYFIIDDWE